MADRYWCSYWLIALLPARSVDVNYGQNGARKTDFRKGKRLGARHHRVKWSKPRLCPDRMEKEHSETFPQTHHIRVTQVASEALGTAILSPDDAPKSALSKLYQQRRQVKLNLRHIKTTLGMETLAASCCGMFDAAAPSSRRCG